HKWCHAELNGDAVLATDDTLTLQYRTDKFVELSRTIR
ncbi:unnamed protein product, partial [marine sediment metagenome]